MNTHLQTDAVSVACKRPYGRLSTSIADVTCPDCLDELETAEHRISEQAAAGWRHGQVVPWPEPV